MTMDNDYSAMTTYAEAQYLAGQIVADITLHDVSKEIIMDGCLIAGKLRGLCIAGEPVDSNVFESTHYVASAFFKFLQATIKDDADVRTG